MVSTASVRLAGAERSWSLQLVPGKRCWVTSLSPVELEVVDSVLVGGAVGPLRWLAESGMEEVSSERAKSWCRSGLGAGLGLPEGGGFASPPASMPRSTSAAN